MKDLIYAKLVDEDIDVWKPIEAEAIGSNKYIIQTNDKEVSLKKGNIVKVKKHIFSDNTEGLIIEEVIS